MLAEHCVLKDSILCFTGQAVAVAYRLLFYGFPGEMHDIVNYVYIAAEKLVHQNASQMQRQFQQCSVNDGLTLGIRCGVTTSTRSLGRPE